ncbi:MAG: hypothetical protein FJY75_06085 [Candidatus Eisenbacteria bacterium]|uniref:Uncharacterized protein n=1 Tax=Eiseniibacteriota bacterium TaxID=2212470 RepID=A0A937XAE2_UNCEI|nr:hypothetical protein [Candidatus Eisenbacteria bacterium]
MRRVLLALAVMGLVTGAAIAQPATDLGGGVFIAHAPAGLVYSSDPPAEGWCHFGRINGCDDQLNDYLPTSDYVVMYVVAGFLQESQWCGIEFGVSYAPGLLMTEFGRCVPSDGLEIAQPGWPASGTGISIVTTDVPWTGNFLPVYWFSAYAYGSATTFALGDHLGTPGPTAFANCAQQEFPAVCYGAFGFANTMGVDCCPEIPPPPSWACCLYDGSCIFVTEEDCAGQNGVWYPGMTCEQVECPFPMVCCIVHECLIIHPDECLAQGGVVHPEFEDCTDNPCEELTPADPSSWGSIKAIYR